MSRHRLSALFDTPSSPLAPPAGSNDNMGGTTPVGSPSHRTPSNPTTPIHHRRPSSSPYAPARNNRQRRSSIHGFEDFTQAAGLTARKLKLKPEGVMMLDDFTKNAISVNEVKSYAQLIKITEMQALVGPTAANFSIPKKLDHKIDIHSFRTMMSPTLGFYVKKSRPDSPSGIMKTLIIEHGEHWGVTNETIDDNSRWSIIGSCVRTRLTDRRYEIKKTASHSLHIPSASQLSADPLQLFEAVWTSAKAEDGETVVTEREDLLYIVQLCEALANIVPNAGVKVTLPMLGWVAVLRQVLIDVNGGSKFWEKVDEQLSLLRETYENEEARISQAIGKVLKNDCRTFGAPDLSLFN
ncbi:hypothetical protein B0H13DRAFT_2306060 [Mycena leptocephala]|nr:hypothetical protein B0H13DRAFT_2306060 [Mycena leptocephala]